MHTHSVERLQLDGLDLNVPSVAQVSNLLTNPSFETNTTSWQQNAATGSFVRTAVTDAVSGDYVLRQTCPGTNPSEGIANSATMPGATASVAHTASAWVRTTTGSKTLNISILEWTAADGLVGTTAAGPFTVTTTWQRIQVSRTFGATGVKASMIVSVNGTQAATFDVDALQIETASSANTYFDGSYPGYEWAGTAHGSKSDPVSAQLTLVDLDLTPPPKTFEWAKSADQHGATLVRPPFHELRQVAASVRVHPQTTLDAALTILGELVDKVQSCEREAAGGLSRGLELIYTPAGSTYNFTLYARAGEVVGAPLDVLRRVRKAPTVEIVLWCDPFGYEDEVSSSTTSSTLPLVTKSLTATAGDVAAEARLTVTDTATQARDHVEFGVEAGANAWVFLEDSDTFVTSGYAGAQTTRAGAYDVGGGNTVVRATLTSTPVACLSTAELTHIGSFRVKARVYASADGVSLRLAWRQGRDSFTENLWQSPVASAKWCEVDLGVVTLREALLGTQTWTGRVEAKATTAGTTLDVDYLEFIPVAAGYGKARTPILVDSPTTFSARDEFDQSAGALAGKTAAVGGVWVGAGDADDFSVETTGKTAQRTAVSDAGTFQNGRFAISGVAAFAAQVAHIDFKTTAWGEGGNDQWNAVIARYSATTDFLIAGVNSESTSARMPFVAKRVASTNTFLYGPSTDYVLATGAWYSLRLLVDAAGRWYFWLFPQGGVPALVASGQDSVLATGGALDDGKPGFLDGRESSVAATRNYDNFAAWVPETDHAINSGQSLEFRANGDPCIREDTTGTYWGRPGEFNGSRFYLPVDDSRVVVKARRNDVDTLPDENVADGIDVTVHSRARHLVIPRAA